MKDKVGKTRVSGRVYKEWVAGNGKGGRWQ